MLLREWRKNQDWPLTKMAREVGQIVGRKLHDRTVLRFETGENQTPTDIAEALRLLTKGAVGPADIHAARVEYMLDNGMLEWLTKELSAK